MDNFKLIAFDVDGTLTNGNIWQRLHKVVGVTPEEDHKWFMDYYNNNITFKEWADVIDEKYRKSGKTKKELQEVMVEVSFVSDAKLVVTTLQTRYPLCLISSGVDIYVAEVAKGLSISDYSANYSFKYDREYKISGISYEAPEDKAKVTFLKRYCENKWIKPEEIVFVGDSSNDLEAFHFTKRGILVGPGNEKLRNASWKHVETLREIIPLLLP